MYARWIALVLALTASVPAVAAAQVRTAAVERMRLLNTRAMEEYDSLEFDSAKEHLLQALQVAREADVSRGKTLVKTHLNLGLVFGAGLNDSLKAVEHFTIALRLSPRATLDPARATPTLEQMFQTARDNAGKAGPLRLTASSMRHRQLDEIERGQPARLFAELDQGSGAAEVAIFYRAVGTEAYRRLGMQQIRPGVYLGTIPPVSGETRALYYYIEAFDDKGRRLAGNGSDGSPNIITVREPRGGRWAHPPSTARSSKRVTIAMMVGSGGGIVYGGQTDNIGASITPTDSVGAAGPGFALAPFHLAPEVSYHVTDRWHVGVLGRIQLINAVRKGQGVTSRISVLGEARAKRFFGQGPLRFYAAFGAGGGLVRHRIPINPDETSAVPSPVTIDTRAAGYVGFGAGGGLIYMFTDMLGFGADINSLILVPNFAVHFDLNTGLLVSF